MLGLCRLEAFGNDSESGGGRKSFRSSNARLELANQELSKHYQSSIRRRVDLHLYGAHEVKGCFWVCNSPLFLAVATA